LIARVTSPHPSTEKGEGRREEGTERIKREEKRIGQAENQVVFDLD